MTKEQAIMTHALIYETCRDIKDKTPKVNKALRQIRLGMKRKDEALYLAVKKEGHDAWGRARQSLIAKDEKLDTKINELLMTLYNAIPSPYKNMYFTDKTFSGMVNSFESCHNSRADKYVYTQRGRDLGNAFLDELGVKRSNKLNRLKYTIEQNMIIENKRIAV